MYSIYFITPFNWRFPCPDEIGLSQRHMLAHWKPYVLYTFAAERYWNGYKVNEDKLKFNENGFIWTSVLTQHCYTTVA